MLPDPRKPKRDPVRPEILIFEILCGLAKPGESLLDAAERVVVVEAYWRCERVQTRTASLLGLSPRTLNYHLAKHGLRPKDEVTAFPVRKVVGE